MFWPLVCLWLEVFILCFVCVGFFFNMGRGGLIETRFIKTITFQDGVGGGLIRDGSLTERVSYSQSVHVTRDQYFRE